MSSSSAARISATTARCARSKYSAIIAVSSARPRSGSSSRPARQPARRALEAPADLARDALGRRRAHASELVVELGQRGRGWRRDEVRHVALRATTSPAGRAARSRSPPVAARRARPRQVQRVRGGIAQHVRAPRQVEERRDRKARADQVLVAEAEADHHPILPQPFG
jgi:hypothetical protein